MSRRLYANHKYVKSGLVTGTMWDVMLKYMQENRCKYKRQKLGKL